MTWCEARSLRPWRRWAWLVAYIAAVYASSPFTGTFAEHLEGQAAGRVVLWVVPLAAAAALVPLAGALGYGREPKRWVAPVVVTVVLYMIVWFEVCQQAVEGIHLPQYGLMALLALRALRPAMPAGLAYAMSVVLTMAVSWGGELIQATLPDRVYDLRDVFLDGVSAVLGLIVAWQLERGRERGEWSPAGSNRGGGQTPVSQAANGGAEP